MGRPVIMGRKTFASLGRPLKGRTNIVVSRDPAFSAPGVLVAATIERALEAARGDALRRGVREIVIGGGSHIYAAVMPLATRLDITRVKAHPPGDTTFPPIDPDVWQETGRSEHPAGPDDEAPYAFVSYSRR
jgi:dihydrofolate reductase